MLSQNGPTYHTNVSHTLYRTLYPIPLYPIPYIPLYPIYPYTLYALIPYTLQCIPVPCLCPTAPLGGGLASAVEMQFQGGRERA
eukprot:11371707-Heterocapsa_arctica.AAC.1